MASWQIVRAGARIEIAGELRIADSVDIWQTLRALAESPGTRLDLDLSQATLVDGAIMSLLVATRSALAARGVLSEIVGAPPRVAALVHLYRGDEPPARGSGWPRRTGSPIEWLGEAALGVARRARSLVVFAAELLGAFAADVRGIDRRSIPSLIVRAGSDAIPVVAVVNFLIGFTMAYQSMLTLKKYGANIYVADIVGVSVTRELAPLMTAILVIGRSGAAYAAELGAMRVSEEIDALRTMGFSPTSHLVAPRVVALAVVAPMLTLIGDIAGITGGLFVATTTLGVTVHGYVAELRSIVETSDVWTGLVKSFAFGLAIAFIGCRQGLTAKGAASGVGRSTTTTVVASTFSVIVIDAVFTVVFRGFRV
jgi:phospholipid/cholesterol/gamma-HCH transport system permease protein